AKRADRFHLSAAGHSAGVDPAPEWLRKRLLSSTIFIRVCVTIRAYRSRFSHLEDYSVTATCRKRLSLTFESVVSDFPVAGVAELADALDAKPIGPQPWW